MSDQHSTSLGEGIRALVARMDKRGKVGAVRVLEAWSEAVGPEIEAHTFVEGLDKGVLAIAVDSAAWANELSAMSAQLRDRVEQAAGGGLVREIRFNVSRKVSEQRAQQQRVYETERGYGGDTVEPAALTSDELAAIERSVADIPEGPLRDAALRATIRDLEWKKGLERANAPQRGAGGPREAK